MSSYTINFLIGNTLEPKCLNLDVWWFETGASWNNECPHALEVQFHLQSLEFETPTKNIGSLSQSG
jgi:hypothetical protein